MTLKNVLIASGWKDASIHCGRMDDTIYLIYLLNAKASETVITPFGRAPVFELKHIVKQGTVLGPILKNCSLHTICRVGSGYQMGHSAWTYTEKLFTSYNM